MNQYGIQALQHWQKFLPERYIEIENPETYFTELGNQISQAIEQRADFLVSEHETENSTARDYQTTVAHLSSARAQAETETLYEFLPAPPEDETPVRMQNRIDQMQRIDATTRP